MIPPERTAAAILAAVALVLAGCGGAPGGASRPYGGAAAGCLGGAGCPFSEIRLIGQRGEGILRGPEAVAVAPSGETYVGDQYSYVVQVFSPTGQFEREWGSFGDGPGQFGAIGGLGLDVRGNVYLVDATHDRVEKFSPSGRFERAWGSPGSGRGQFDFGGGGRSDQPPGGGIAVRGSFVYVADSANDRIERFTPEGTHPVVWGGPGRGRGRFANPRGLAAAREGIYVADDANRRIQLLSPRGRFVRQAGRFGRGPGQFADPLGVAVDGRGAVYVADDNNNRIVKLTPGLRYVRAWNRFGSAHTLSYVRALAAADGQVVVADTGNDRIEVFHTNGSPVREWGTSPDTPGQFLAPLDVTANRSGAIFVVVPNASRSHIDRFSSSLAFQSRTRGGHVKIGTHFFVPTAAAAAPDGSLWVTDPLNDRLRHLTPDGAFAGAIGGGGHRANPRARFSHPAGVAVDGAGDVLVADTGHNRVEKLNARGQFESAWGSHGSGHLQFNGPLALAGGPAGAIYVADTGNNRIEKLDPAGRFLTAWGSPGTGLGQFDRPAGVVVASSGEVFVSDSNNDRVQKFTSDGRFLTAWGVPGSAPGQFNHPGGLSIDCRGDLLVADTRNNRVQVFGRAAPATGCAGG